MSPLPILFVINPKAGTKHKGDFIDQASLHLDQSLFTPEWLYTECQGHAGALAAEARRKGIPYVVAVGGDGTINECASSLVGSDTALGIVPMGSGNGLARDLRIPLDPVKAVQMLNHHKRKAIDCGLANGHHFFCTCGVGFDAYISERFSRNKQRGLIGYLRSIVEEFMQYENQEYHLSVSGVQHTYKAFSITFANAGQFGNNAFISPHADIRDGELDLCVVRDYPKHLGLSLGLRLFNKSIHKSRYVKITRLQQAVVHCPKNSYYHRDGEVAKLDGGTLKVSILPQALLVMTDNFED